MIFKALAFRTSKTLLSQRFGGIGLYSGGKMSFSNSMKKLVPITDEQQMEKLGAYFCEFLEVGDTILLNGNDFYKNFVSFVYCDIGDLGAGKSTFSRGLIRTAFDDPSMLVTSPSYLLDNKYELSEDVVIHHMDLYRLPEKCDFSFLNIPKVFDESICLIEWPQRLGADNYPKQYIDLNISINMAETRKATIEFVGEKWIQRNDLINSLLTSFLLEAATTTTTTKSTKL